MFETEDCSLVTAPEAIPFETPIGQTIKINGVKIVRLELTSKNIDIKNVYGIDKGQVIWQVQDMREYNPTYADTLLPQWNPYTLIGPMEESSTLFWGTTAHGDCFRIDSQTGKIVGYEGWFK